MDFNAEHLLKQLCASKKRYGIEVTKEMKSAMWENFLRQIVTGAALVTVHRNCVSMPKICKNNETECEMFTLTDRFKFTPNVKNLKEINTGTTNSNTFINSIVTSADHVKIECKENISIMEKSNDNKNATAPMFLENHKMDYTVTNITRNLRKNTRKLYQKFYCSDPEITSNPHSKRKKSKISSSRKKEKQPFLNLQNLIKNIMESAANSCFPFLKNPDHLNSYIAIEPSDEGEIIFKLPKSAKHKCTIDLTNSGNLTNLFLKPVLSAEKSSQTNNIDTNETRKEVQPEQMEFIVPTTPLEFIRTYLCDGKKAEPFYLIPASPVNITNKSESILSTVQINRTYESHLKNHEELQAMPVRVTSTNGSYDKTHYVNIPARLRKNLNDILLPKTCSPDKLTTIAKQKAPVRKRGRPKGVGNTKRGITKKQQKTREPKPNQKLMQVQNRPRNVIKLNLPKPKEGVTQFIENAKNLKTHDDSYFAALNMPLISDENEEQTKQAQLRSDMYSVPSSFVNESTNEYTIPSFTNGNLYTSLTGFLSHDDNDESQKPLNFDNNEAINEQHELLERFGLGEVGFLHQENFFEVNIDDNINMECKNIESSQRWTMSDHTYASTCSSLKKLKNEKNTSNRADGVTILENRLIVADTTPKIQSKQLSFQEPLKIMESKESINNITKSFFPILTDDEDGTDIPKTSPTMHLIKNAITSAIELSTDKVDKKSEKHSSNNVDKKERNQNSSLGRKNLDLTEWDYLTPLELENKLDYLDFELDGDLSDSAENDILQDDTFKRSTSSQMSNALLKTAKEAMKPISDSLPESTARSSEILSNCFENHCPFEMCKNSLETKFEQEKLTEGEGPIQTKNYCNKAVNLCTKPKVLKIEDIPKKFSGVKNSAVVKTVKSNDLIPRKSSVQLVKHLNGNVFNHFIDNARKTGYMNGLVKASIPRMKTVSQLGALPHEMPKAKKSEDCIGPTHRSLENTAGNSKTVTMDDFTSWILNEKTDTCSPNLECAIDRNFNALSIEELDENSKLSTFSLEDIIDFFNISCLPWLIDKCTYPEACTHELRDLENVSLTFVTMQLSNVHILYMFVRKHEKLFSYYFDAFFKNYKEKKCVHKLCRLIFDGERYEFFKASNLVVIFDSLQYCGLNKQQACKAILKHSRRRTEDFIETLMRIIVISDWKLFEKDIREILKEPAGVLSTSLILEMAQTGPPYPDLKLHELLVQMCLRLRYSEKAQLVLNQTLESICNSYILRKNNILQ